MRPSNAIRLFTAAAAALLWCGNPARASISYSITIDTSSISGTAGSLDFVFDPSNVYQAATADISNFAPSANLGAIDFSAFVSGALPPDIRLSNAGNAEYLVDFTYASSLSFLLTLDGPAINAPDGTSTGGTRFAFTMFNSDQTAAFLTTDDIFGYAFLVDINLDGTTTVTDNITGTHAIDLGVPEPASIGLTIFGLAALAFELKRRSRMVCPL